MKTVDIEAKLRKATTSDDAHAVIGLIAARRAEIDRRIAAIAPSLRHPDFPHPAERLAALRGGFEAVKALDEEQKGLTTERDYLAHLEQTAFDAMERLRLDAIRAAVPKALKRLPGAMRDVRQALEAYDASVAALNATLEAIAGYAEISMPFPLSDDELAEVLQLREKTWAPRDLRALLIVDRETFPKSWPLLHAFHAGDAEEGGIGGAFHIRRPPTFEAWPSTDAVISESAGRW